MEKGIFKYHPLMIVIYFISTMVLSFISKNPIIIVEELIIASFYIFSNLKLKEIKMILISMSILFIFCVLINPIFVNAGQMVLVEIGDKPIYLEALIYGIINFFIILTITFFMIYFLKGLDFDKILLIFGAKLPYISLLLKMILRYIPLIKRRYNIIKEGIKGLNINPNERRKLTIEEEKSIVKSLFNWSFESAIKTSSLMNAKGYGIKKRSSINEKKLTKKDMVALILMMIYFIILIYRLNLKEASWTIYPTITHCSVNIGLIFTVLMFSIYLLIPLILEVKDKIKIKIITNAMKREIR